MDFVFGVKLACACKSLISIFLNSMRLYESISRSYIARLWCEIFLLLEELIEGEEEDSYHPISIYNGPYLSVASLLCPLFAWTQCLYWEISERYSSCRRYKRGLSSHILIFAAWEAWCNMIYSLNWCQIFISGDLHIVV